MITAELLQDHGLAHAGVAMHKEARHAITLRIRKQIFHRFQRGLGGRVTDPALGTDPLNAVIVW